MTRQDLLQRLAVELQKYEQVNVDEPVNVIVNFDNDDGQFEYMWNGDKFLINQRKPAARRVSAVR